MISDQKTVMNDGTSRNMHIITIPLTAVTWSRHTDLQKAPRHIKLPASNFPKQQSRNPTTHFINTHKDATLAQLREALTNQESALQVCHHLDNIWDLSQARNQIQWPRERSYTFDKERKQQDERRRKYATAQIELIQVEQCIKHLHAPLDKKHLTERELSDKLTELRREKINSNKTSIC